jgi:hypothetical protein
MSLSGTQIHCTCPGCPACLNDPSIPVPAPQFGGNDVRCTDCFARLEAFLLDPDGDLPD